jgi:biotin carboxylase
MADQKKSARSALSAALASGAPAPNVHEAAAPSAHAGAFPGVSGAVAGDGDADLAAEVAAMSLRGSGLAGSAPTAALRASGAYSADFELPPFSLRSGRERVPAALAEGVRAANFISEAAIGSLPRGLSLTEKELVFAATPLSPALSRLSSTPSALVAARTLEGRRLRRHVLRGAVVVFITAGYSGKRFIYERAKELGVRAVIVDGPDSWSRDLVAEGVIEKFVGLDMSDAETLFERCLAAITRVARELGELDGVCSFSEMAMPLVARLAEKLGLPGNTPDAVDAARDKHQTRSRMAAAGLPTPRHFLIEAAAQLDAAAAEVGFPAVIKPIFGAASIGVVRVDSLEELRAAYARVVRDMGGARIVAGALQLGDGAGADGAELSPAPSDGGGTAASWIKTTIMMEEYLDGPEVDVDVVFSESQAVYGVVTDNWPTVEPYFNETGSNAPSILPAYQQRELLDLAVRAVSCLGFALGVFHVECKYTSRGPRLIEVNCRMGGGPVRSMNLLVWGVDLVEEQLLCNAGIPSRPPTAAQPLAHVAEFSVNAMRSGTLRDLKVLEKFDGAEGVLYARALVEPGAKVVCASDGLPTWVCELMVAKPTVDEAIAFVKGIEAEIQGALAIEP